MQTTRWMRVAARFTGKLAIAVAIAGTAARAQGPAASPAAAPAVSGDAAAAERVQPLMAAHHGKVAMFAVQWTTGKTLAVDADLPVQTASDIKLAILYHAMAEIRAGRARWDEKITLAPGEAVGGSGMLLFFDAPLTVTLKDVLTMMVIVSDNTATNLMIDRFGVDAINARVEALGLRNTHLYKKVMKPAAGPMPADQPKFGLGKTTAREMATLMTRIGKCQLHPDRARATPVPPGSDEGFATPDAEDLAVCAVGLKMLKTQFYRETIPRLLPGGGDGTVASKTGSLNAVRNDVAIVAGRSGPMVLAIFTYDNADQSWTVDNEGEMTVAKLAAAVVGAWSPAGLDATALVPGLGLAAGPAAGAEAGRQGAKR